MSARAAWLWWAGTRAVMLLVGIAVAAATQLTFPVAFFALFDADGALLQPATLVLAARNLLLVVFCGWAVAVAWAATSNRPSSATLPLISTDHGGHP